jgi:hypothetical protein
MELILEIVLQNATTFQNTAKEEIGNILLINRECAELSKLNNNIQQRQNKYYVEYMHKMLRENIEHFVNTKSTSEIQTHEYHQKLHKILGEIYASSEEIQDCFINTIIAEYKELIYCNLCDPTFEYASYQILIEYENILYSDDILCDMLWNHEHDPTHYMFYTDSKVYMFFELLERKGYYILDMWESGEHS